jgi:hypothetical protein
MTGLTRKILPLKGSNFSSFAKFIKKIAQTPIASNLFHYVHHEIYFNSAFIY